MNVLSWVSTQKARAGHPGLIMIVGDGRRTNVRVLDESVEAV
jgi:hypothetical protein